MRVYSANFNRASSEFTLGSDGALRRPRRVQRRNCPRNDWQPFRPLLHGWGQRSAMSLPRINCCLLLVLLLVAGTGHALAYPEYQQFIVKHSGRKVDCAFCHANADGPVGTAPGQIGHLTAAEQAELVRARAAFEPGQKVNSPILNAFGNHIINSIGRKKFLELRLAPEQLAEVLPKDSDLDGDGIPDVQEYLAGTHPLIQSDGNPWLLFRNNFRRNLPQILLTLAATVSGLWGLSHLLHGFATAMRLKEEDNENANGKLE